MAHRLNLLGNYADNALTTTYGGVDTDWLELDDVHVFMFNLPGVRREDVQVLVVGGDTMQVSGVRNAYVENSLMMGRGGRAGIGESMIKWHVKERAAGSFVRKFQLPNDVNVEGINVIEDKGVLVVTLPKLFPSSKPPRYLRNIPISFMP